MCIIVLSISISGLCAFCEILCFQPQGNSCEYTVFFKWLHDQDIFKYCEAFKEGSIFTNDIYVTPLVCALCLLSDEMTDFDGAFGSIDVRSNQFIYIGNCNSLLAHMFYRHSF